VHEAQLECGVRLLTSGCWATISPEAPTFTVSLTHVLATAPLSGSRHTPISQASAQVPAATQTERNRATRGPHKTAGRGPQRLAEAVDTVAGQEDTAA
jgi:hypothetical protein